MGSHYTTRQHHDSQHLLEQAARCVKCGLCLPSCPTYQLTRNEADSPRGRIALIQAVLQHDLAADRSGRRHLDACLLCRRCERSCPSNVPYGELMDAIRARPALRRPWWLRLLLRFISEPALAPLRRQLGRIRHRYQGGVAATPAVTASQAPLARSSPLRLGVLPGCGADLLLPELGVQLVWLLNRMGFQAELLEPGCCGALARHQGEGALADRLAAGLARAIPAHIDTLVALNPVCARAISDRPGAVTCVEACTFLEQQQERLAQLPLRPLPERVTVYHACSQVSLGWSTGAPGRLLGMLPEVELHELQAQAGCCGAAGLQMLLQRTQAAALRAPLVARLERQRSSYLVSSSIGCVNHILAGTQVTGARLAHPVSLLVQQLQQGKDRSNP